MQLNVKTAMSLLALVAVSACLGAPVTSAHASDAGGVGAPAVTTTSTPASTPITPQVRAIALATWFGPGFFGKQTACGQTLTPAVVGVANRTLPCGTLVKVSYGAHTLVVPVLDRGPYGHIGADWDLTAGAAEALGVTETVHIHAHVVGTTANVPSLGLPPASASPATPESALAGGAQAG
jgi:rare lipoprotein A (peptidoglycan hydrolase)